MNNEKKAPVRQINFRGLRVDGKGFAFGFYCNIQDKEHYILEPCALGLLWTEVIPETVGQFTGLLDKNGKEIFEGDVFTANEYPFVDNGKPNYNGVVYWVFAGFQYYLTLVNQEKRGISQGVNEPLEEGDWIEVIGNIHEESDINSIEGKENNNV